MDSKASQEAGDKRKILEKEAFQLRAEGRLVPALEKLEQAMKLGEQWYHLFYKAIWLWDAGKVPDSVKTIEIGINFEMEKEFFFRVLSADFLFRTVVASANASQDLKKSVGQLDQAWRELDRAEYCLFQKGPEINRNRLDVPEELKKLWPTSLNFEDFGGQARFLRTRVETIRQSLILFQGMMDTENRMNAAIEENRRRIDSERTRIIELLGIFTAIFAFIFSGVQIFTRLSLSDALVLQVGMALLMIVFLMGVHLVVDPEGRTKLLVVIFSILLIMLVALPFYAELLKGGLHFRGDVKSTEQKVPMEIKSAE